MLELKPEIEIIENRLSLYYHVYNILAKTSISCQLVWSRKKDEIWKYKDVLGVMQAVAIQIDTMKTDIEKIVRKTTKQHPMWGAFFSKIKGVGELYAGFVLGKIPARKFPYPSKMYKFVGLSPPSVYGGKKTYNRGIKRILYIIGMNFLKQKNKYSTFYYKWYMEEMEKLEHPEKFNNPPKNRMHVHLRAMRKMLKMFLGHYYEVYFRTILGIEAPKPYFVERGFKEYYVPPEELFDV